LCPYETFIFNKPHPSYSRSTEVPTNEPVGTIGKQKGTVKIGKGDQLTNKFASVAQISLTLN